MSFRILVADDHELVRRGVCRLLANHPGWEVCGEAADGRKTIEQALALKPDVIVLDISMPDMNGLIAIRSILRDLPQTKILVLTMHESEQILEAVMSAGAKGLVYKSDALRDVVTAISALARNSTYFTKKVVSDELETYGDGGAPAASVRRSHLTPRERELVQMLAEGKTTREAAALLDMSIKTAETHRANVMRKLQLHSASELVMYAVRNRLIMMKPDFNAGEI